MVPAPTNPSSKSKQASSSIDLGWGICSSAKKNPKKTVEWSVEEEEDDGKEDEELDHEGGKDNLIST